MAYVIPSNGDNMLMTFKEKIIRVPLSFGEKNNLEGFKSGDRIFIFNYEDGSLYGPLYCKGSPNIEKNPKRGPFNGWITKKYYYYYTLNVDTGSCFKRGVVIREFDARLNFILGPEYESIIMKRLMLKNMNFSSSIVDLQISKVNKNSYNVKCYCIYSAVNDNPVSIVENNFIISKESFSLLSDLVKDVEAEAVSGSKMFSEKLRKYGQLLFRVLIRPLKIENMFVSGSKLISFFIGGREFQGLIYPEYINTGSNFLLKDNIFTHAIKNKRYKDIVSVSSMLVFADPDKHYRGAYRNGLEVFRAVSDLNVNCDFISRPLAKSDFLKLLEDYDILHFEGHGSFGDSTVMLDIGRDKLSIADIPKGLRLPDLLFLNVCGKGLVSGKLLMDIGVNDVIMPRWEIQDLDISMYLKSFYSLLLSGVSIGESFYVMNAESMKHGSPGALGFALFGNGKTVYENY